MIPARKSRTLTAGLAAVSSLAVALSLVLLPAAPAGGADWSNSGGNAGRNGLTTAIGFSAAEPLWSGGRNSLIAWLPVTEGGRMFTVRQPRWPYQQPNDAYVVATDVATGGERWAIVLPYNSGDWIPWIAGVRDGKVYCSRSGNGASVSARMYALDVVDGHTVWVTQDLQDAGAYDGVVFAPDGDPIVASFRTIWRFDAADGHTVWSAPRTGSVSGNCGGALLGNAFYVADAAPGGHVLVRYDLATGARMYQSPLMPGFTIQNTPMVGPDGTVYLNRAQSNPAVDFTYAFRDDGTQFIEKWHVPGMGGAGAEFGIGPDGSVYVIVPGPCLARLDPDDGAILNQTPALSGFSSAHVAVDALGRVFFSNGAFATGRLYAYDADLTPRWDVAVPNINIGGPTIAADGTLIVCGTGADVRAYRGVGASDVAAGAGRGRLAASVEVAPNPFRESAALRFRAEGPGAATLEVFDVGGARVKTILAGEGIQAGDHVAVWRGETDAGGAAGPGVYFWRLRLGNDTAAGRVLLAR